MFSFTISFFFIIKRRGSSSTPNTSKHLIFKSAATSNLREYTGSKILNSGISLNKRQIAFLATVSLYKSSTVL